MKTCLDCSKVLPLGDFPPAAKRTDGRGSYCRVCMRARSTASYKRRRQAQGTSVKVLPSLPDGFRRCPDCGEVKSLEDFPRNKNGSKGRGSYCKPCHNSRGRASKHRVGGFQEYHRASRYGMEPGQFDEMFVDQGGMCAVCRERPAEHVDHDHLTGAVRGILCFNCNGGLGQFRDRVDIMAKAIAYLERTRGATWLTVVTRMEAFPMPTPRSEAVLRTSSGRRLPDSSPLN